MKSLCQALEEIVVAFDVVDGFIGFFHPTSLNHKGHKGHEEVLKKGFLHFLFHVQIFPGIYVENIFCSCCGL